ncbi:hypothetical protein LIER_36124 [Lithospermum erythrorhizon]|uniref:BZIP domain-containing protein n=1 Tax=Lithospermum erythrorhizon TaxID=34254 RepID=A0AAV3P2Y1_LITER
MAIPQDVAANIARSLNDAEGEESPPATEVFSIQPFAVRYPKTVPANPASTPSSTPTAPPSTHGAGASQTGTSAVKTGEHRPLFHKSKVRKVPTSSGTHAGKEPYPSTAAAAATSTSNAEKRPALEERRPRSDALDNVRAKACEEERVLRLQKEKKEAQERCIKQDEKLELIHSRLTRLEVENVGLTNRLKNA